MINIQEYTEIVTDSSAMGLYVREGNVAKRFHCFRDIQVFTLSYRHLSVASGIIRLLRNICLGHVYTWMYRKHMYSFL